MILIVKLERCVFFQNLKLYKSILKIENKISVITDFEKTNVENKEKKNILQRIFS